MNFAEALIRLALPVILTCLVAAESRADDEAGRIAASVNRSFRPLMQEHDVPGLAVAVTARGKQYIFTYGLASKEIRTPVTKDTLFEIGSVSKTFTATLISHAHALGRMSLEDRPGKYLPELRGGAVDRASLLHLATYTAGGLPLQFPGTVTNMAQMLDYFRHWTPSFEPGTKRQYSNPSIGLAGYIAASVMGGEFAHIVASEVFTKLGLTQSFIRVPAAEMSKYAWGYDRNNKPIRVNPGVLDAENYGVKSSAADLIRFVEINLRPESIGTSARQAIEGTHIGYFRVGDMVQGLGWEQYPFPITLDRLLAGNSASRPAVATRVTPLRRPVEPTLFNKTGSTNGFGAYIAFVPARQIGIVMLANKNVPIPARITAAFAVLEQLSALPDR